MKERNETSQTETIGEEQRPASATQKCTSAVTLCRLLWEIDKLTPLLPTGCAEENIPRSFHSIKAPV